MTLHGVHLDLSALSRGAPALAGLALLWIGLFAALSRRRLDALAAGFFVAGFGVAAIALGLGLLSGAVDAGLRVARAALAVSVAQAVAGLAIARATGARARVTRTDRLERLHG
jgi:hypothetical protein